MPGIPLRSCGQASCCLPAPPTADRARGQWDARLGISGDTDIRAAAGVARWQALGGGCRVGRPPPLSDT